MTGLPAGVELVRTTPEFEASSVPAGLLRSHRIAERVWGRLRVTRGTLTLVFEDDASSVRLHAGDAVVIPPDRPHHVEPGVAARFSVEFHR